MNTLQQQAEYWNNQGIACIPVAYRDKRPVVQSWREFQDRLPTLAEIARWFQSRLRNLAIITGWKGLTVLDFDAMPAYDLWRVAYPDVAQSYSVVTSRGVHVYLFVDEPVSSGKLGMIDIKAAGGYVLAPPSIHPSGRQYRAVNDSPILRVDSLACVLPKPLLALAQPAPVRVPVIQSDDPWQAAMNPATASGNGGKVAAILANHSLFELFPQAQKRGNYYWTRCPLHNDHDPSLSISQDGDYGRCWAGCLHGDYLDWFAAVNGLELMSAIEVLS
jgi:hypothetical protein